MRFYKGIYGIVVIPGCFSVRYSSFLSFSIWIQFFNFNFIKILFFLGSNWKRKKPVVLSCSLMTSSLPFDDVIFLLFFNKNENHETIAHKMPRFIQSTTIIKDESLDNIPLDILASTHTHNTRARLWVQRTKPWSKQLTIELPVGCLFARRA